MQNISHWCQLLLVLLPGLILTGCTKSFDNLDEYEKFVRSEESPYVKTVARSGVKVTVRYVPTDALMIPEYRRFAELQTQLDADTSKTSVQRDSLLEADRSALKKNKAIYDNSIYFAMTIGYEDGKRDIEYEPMSRSYGAYSAWLQKLLFSMREYINLESAIVDEVPLALYDMQRTYGLTKDRTFLLVFPKTFNDHDLLNVENKVLRFHVNEFGMNTGNLTFDFDLPLETVHLALHS